MYTLYWSPDTGAFAVQAVLEELGQAYERVPVLTREQAHRQPAYLALNPMGQVPSLRLPDGGPLLTETAAIILALCDRHPEAGLLPAPGTPERAQAYRLLFWMAVNLYEPDLRYYYPERYGDGDGAADAVRRAALRRLDESLAMAENLLGGRASLLEDGGFSALDIYLFLMILWHPAGPALLERHPGLAPLMAAVRSRPAIGRIWDQHVPAVEGGSPWSTWTGSKES